jgi:hypothetical protein
MAIVVRGKHVGWIVIPRSSLICKRKDGKEKREWYVEHLAQEKERFFVDEGDLADRGRYLVNKSLTSS